jgi:hypothetical protein
MTKSQYGALVIEKIEFLKHLQKLHKEPDTFEGTNFNNEEIKNTQIITLKNCFLLFVK